LTYWRIDDWRGAGMDEIRQFMVSVGPVSSVAQFRRDLLSYPTNWLPVSRHVSHTVLILLQKAKSVPNKMRRRVIAFFNTLWSENAIYDESDIIAMLPASMKNELVGHLYKQTIESVALFSNLDEDVLIKICIALEHTVVLRKDFIIVQGEIGQEMYILETGMAEAYVATDACHHKKGDEVRCEQSSVESKKDFGPCCSGSRVALAL
jgi:hypothetical protein